MEEKERAVYLIVLDAVYKEAIKEEDDDLLAAISAEMDKTAQMLPQFVKNDDDPVQVDWLALESAFGLSDWRPTLADVLPVIRRLRSTP